MTLRVNADNAAACSVYERLGFTVTATQAGGPLDEVAMSLTVS